MTKHYITIHSGSGCDKKVSISDYIKAIKFAKENPDMMFKEGLCQWWPVTGKQIYQDYVDSIYARIWTKSGQSWRTQISDEEINEQRDSQKIKSRIIVRNRFDSKSANKRLSHLLYTNDDF